MRKGKRLRGFEGQLPDSLGMWVNGLRSGYSVMQAMEAIATEGPEPTATEFRRVVQEIQLGLARDEAFQHLLNRMPSEDLDLVITAVNIQQEVGGNLAEILDIISHTIRERIKLKGEVRVLTSQGRITGFIIGGLPVVLAIFLYFVSGEYMKRMFRSKGCGWPMLGCGASLIGLGTAAIQKIVDIKI
jgi:tight adherence protein B